MDTRALLPAAAARPPGAVSSRDVVPDPAETRVPALVRIFTPTRTSRGEPGAAARSFE